MNLYPGPITIVRGIADILEEQRMNTTNKEHKQIIARSVEENHGPAMPTIVIRGLPGIGKTTLANALVQFFEDHGRRTFQLNADAVRASVNKKLGFSMADRNEHAARLGAMAWLAAGNECIPVVDFIMPTKTTYDAFQEGLGRNDFLIVSVEDPDFVSRFPDTDKIFQPMQAYWGGAVFGKEHYLTIPRWDPAQIDTIVHNINGHLGDMLIGK